MPTLDEKQKTKTVFWLFYFVVLFVDDLLYEIKIFVCYVLSKIEI